MKINYTVKQSLIKTAQDELKWAEAEVTRLEEALRKAKTSVAEKEVVLNWAEGLVQGADLMMQPDWNQVYRKINVDNKPFNPRKLYYVPSKSGRRYGHYIEVFENSISCTCPGFRNRFYCHAVRTIQNGKGLFQHTWLLAHKEFDKQRDLAYNAD